MTCCSLLTTGPGVFFRLAFSFCGQVCRQSG